MSYILDALKKAERSRQQQPTSDRSLLDRVTTEQAPPPASRWRVLLAVLLLLNGLVLGGLLLSHEWLLEPQGTTTESDRIAMPTVQPANTERRLILPDDPLEVVEPIALSALPPALRQRFGGLNLDLHVYGERPEQRFVLINSRRYRTGDWLSEGPLLEAIIPEGVILSYENARFRLSAQP